MTLRTKLKIRNFLRDAIITIAMGTLLLTAFAIASHYDYEDYCLHHPSQCATTK